MILLTQGVWEMPVPRNDLIQALKNVQRVVSAPQCIIRELGDSLLGELQHNDATEVLLVLSGHKQPFGSCTADQGHGSAAETEKSAGFSTLGSPFEQCPPAQAPFWTGWQNEGMGGNEHVIHEYSSTLSTHAGQLKTDTSR